MNYQPLPPRFGFGLLLIALGGFLFLDKMGYADFGDLIGNWWPLILVYFGVSRLYTSGNFKDWIGLLLIIGGSIIIIDNYYLLPFDFSDFILPGIIIILGVWILTKAFQQPVVQSDSELPEQAGSESFNYSAFFSGSKKALNGSTFSRGTISIFMGGAEIDMRGSVLKPGAVLDLNVIMGGIELRIPEDWVLEYRTQVFLGGIDDGKHPSGQIYNSNTLILTGTILMGGIEIKR